MGLRTLLLDLAGDRGIKIDPDELDSIGLTDDDEIQVGDEVGPAPNNVEVLSAQLPGSASGVAEIFFAAPEGKTVEHGGLLWSPIAVEGQWATRPDGKGGKIKAPLQLVAGTSTNQRRKIGMQDIYDAFNDRAVDDVTIPTTHNNGPLENTGYVEKLALVDGKSKGKTVKVLMAGERYTDKIAEKKVKEGSTRGRSMGLLYDYTRTDTAKTYGVALEHVALTPKPWLRGMPKLARPLSDPTELATVSLSLSDDGPTEADLATLLADVVTDEDPDADFLAEPAIQWAHEDSPEWLKQQVDDILRDARQEKYKARKTKSSGMYVEDSIPHYRAREAKPGSALISDGWGDKSNYWVASISVADGKVTLADFKDWQPTKQVWVSDEREAPTGDKVPLSEAIDIEIENRHEKLLDPLVIAQMMRRTNLSQQDPKPANDPPRGGGEVDGQNSTLQLSDEAKALIEAADARAAAAEKKVEQLSESVDKLLGTNNANAAAAFIAHLKAPADQGGCGLSEDLGFSGMLVEIEQIMLADDGGPAVKSDHFADDKNKDGTITVSDALKRVFGALRTAEGSTLKLGEVITPPATEVEGKDGKPAKTDEGDQIDESKLSDSEILARYEADHPGMLARAGIKLEVPAASTNGDGKG